MTTSELASLAAKNERLAQALHQARAKLEEMDERVAALSARPRTYGTFVRWTDAYADVLVGNRLMNLSVAPGVHGLGRGSRVHLSEQLVVVDNCGYPLEGEVVTAKLLMSGGRILVTSAQSEHVLWVADSLKGTVIKPGDSLRANIGATMVYELLERPDVAKLLLEESPDVDYSDIGGLGSQIEQIRDSIELPFEQPELYREHGLKPPKGVLLYGPPGCGKTLIAKAVASSLAAGSTPHFLNVKGPQLLDKYVGETERQIREIFGKARERAATGQPVVVFFDEMEALFRTRGSGVSSDVETTIVPQLLAEIDGVEKLDNVIVIGASNREDMIDPAILRPGRLDLKVKISRPDRAGSLDIFSKYLTPDLPIHPDEIATWGSAQVAVEKMAEATIDSLFSRQAERAVVELTLADGSRQVLYLSDFVSGAMIAALVDRAKKNAIKDLLSTGVKGLSTDHLLDALDQEAAENVDMSGVVNPSEWARVNGQMTSQPVVGIRKLGRNA